MTQSPPKTEEVRKLLTIEQAQAIVDTLKSRPYEEVAMAISIIMQAPVINVERQQPADPVDEEGPKE